MITLYHELINKKTIKHIARELKRTEGSILSRLKHKSFITFMEEQRLVESCDLEKVKKPFEKEEASYESEESVYTETSEGVETLLDSQESVYTESNEFICVFDTETTGLPEYNMPVNDVNWPRIIQFAYQIHKKNGELVEKECIIIILMVKLNLFLLQFLICIFLIFLLYPDFSKNVLQLNDLFQKIYHYLLFYKIISLLEPLKYLFLICQLVYLIFLLNSQYESFFLFQYYLLESILINKFDIALYI